jgi:hypothetical protein
MAPAVLDSRPPQPEHARSGGRVGKRLDQRPSYGGAKHVSARATSELDRSTKAPKGLAPGTGNRNLTHNTDPTVALPGGPASQRQRAQNRGCGHAVKDFCAYNEKQAAWSAQAQRDFGPVGNGVDGIVGNMDPDHIQTVIDKSADAGMDIPAGLPVEDIVTNKFIYGSIGFE